MRNAKLIKLSGFCAGLLLIRIFNSENGSYAFLVWNLFLAWLPWLIINRYQKTKTTSGRWTKIFITILFLPNAPYMITDLFHLKKSSGVPMWFDLILILSFALLGMLFFILTLRRLLEIIHEITGTEHLVQVAKILLLFSCGYGIYLGRFLRFNSWDVFSDPLYLISEILNSVFNGACYKETLAVTLTFSIFLYLVYEISTSFKHQDHELS